MISTRALRYTTAAAAEDDRPNHVRAASGVVAIGGRLVIVQDDASFLAVVAGDRVGAIALPRGPGGRRRFEPALGNKADKLDLEACVAIADEVWAFGSGATPVRERICRLRGDAPIVRDASELYATIRTAVGHALNLEGAAVVAGELWLFHRGNTGPGDRGPAVARIDLAATRAWLDERGPAPVVAGLDRYDLGELAGVRLGFTDAVALATGEVLFLAAGEAAADAIEDGAIAGTRLGIISGATVRATALVDAAGRPIKAEGLALDPERPGRAWIVVDPDDPAQPSPLCEIELSGPWV